EDSVDLGGVQPVQRRQHQRRAQHAVFGERDDARAGDELPGTDLVERPAHHAAGGQADFLDTPGVEPAGPLLVVATVNRRSRDQENIWLVVAFVASRVKDPFATSSTRPRYSS